MQKVGVIDKPEIYFLTAERVRHSGTPGATAAGRFGLCARSRSSQTFAPPPGPSSRSMHARTLSQPTSLPPIGCMVVTAAPCGLSVDGHFHWPYGSTLRRTALTLCELRLRSRGALNIENRAPRSSGCFRDGQS
jgi:hypothetical protein